LEEKRQQKEKREALERTVHNLGFGVGYLHSGAPPVLLQMGLVGLELIVRLANPGLCKTA
jgi:hypothetical protein